MKFLLLLFLFISFGAFGQASNPNNTFKIGKASSSDQKGFIFDTDDGVLNKTLKVDKTSKSLIWSGNDLVMGDGSSVNDKELTFDPASSTSLKWNGSDNYVELRSEKIRIGQDADNDISLEFGKGGSNPVLKYASSVGKLQFSNDGAIFKDIGSGGGGSAGGINLLTNDGFEDGLGSWSNTGGTFSQEIHANGTDSNVSFGRLAAGGAGHFFESDLVTISDVIGFDCMADFKYRQGDSAFDYQVLNSSEEIQAQGSVNDAAIYGKAPALTFKCAGGEQYKLKIIATGIGTIDVDEVHLGSRKNIYPFSANDTPWKSDGVNLIEGISANPTKPTVVDVDVVRFRKSADSMDVSSTYYAASLTGSNDNSSGDMLFVIPDGKTIDSGKVSFFTGGSEGYGTYMNTGGTILGRIHAVSSVGESFDGVVLPYDSTRVRVLGQFNSHANITRLGSLGSANAWGITTYSSIALNYTVPITGYQADSEFAWTPEAAEFYISANIGGANIVGGPDGSPVENVSSSLDMVVNYGSAKIPCSGVNPPTGLTCSAGSESVGITFNAPEGGKRYRTCFSFGTETSVATNAVMRVVETPSNDAATVLQEGKDIAYIGKHSSGASASSNKVCGTFDMSAGERTVRLFRHANNTVTVLSDRSLYNRDIHVTVEMVGHNVSKPILIDPTAIDTRENSERKIGTWFGKDLYERNFETSFSGSSGVLTTISTGLEPVSLSGMGLLSGGSWASIGGNGSASAGFFYYDPSSGAIGFSYGGDSMTQQKFTIRYVYP